MVTKFLLVCILVSQAFFPLTESRGCMVSNSKPCEKKCCGSGTPPKCSVSCVGIRCSSDFHCDGGCCGLHRRCGENCSTTSPAVLPTSLTSTTSEAGKCKYHHDCKCFGCICNKGACKYKSSHPTKIKIWRPKHAQTTSSSPSIGHKIYIWPAGCIAVVLILMCILLIRPTCVKRPTRRSARRSNHELYATERRRRYLARTDFSVSNQSYLAEISPPRINREAPPSYESTETQELNTTQLPNQAAADLAVSNLQSYLTEIILSPPRINREAPPFYESTEPVSQLNTIQSHASTDLAVSSLSSSEMMLGGPAIISRGLLPPPYELHAEPIPTSPPPPYDVVVNNGYMR